jgi:hypothetical protein
VIYHYASFYRYERESIHGRGKQLCDVAAQAFRAVKEHHDAALAIVRDWKWARRSPSRHVELGPDSLVVARDELVDGLSCRDRMTFRCSGKQRPLTVP